MNEFGVGDHDMGENTLCHYILIWGDANPIRNSNEGSKFKITHYDSFLNAKTGSLIFPHSFWLFDRPNARSGCAGQGLGVNTFGSLRHFLLFNQSSPSCAGQAEMVAAVGNSINSHQRPPGPGNQCHSKHSDLRKYKSSIYDLLRSLISFHVETISGFN